jgi:high frequency lysogenization protein
MLRTDSEVMTQRQTQMVALSMVYAAAQLVHLLATQGASAVLVHQDAFRALITAALSDQTDPCQCYAYPKGTQLGFRTLERCLVEPYSSTPAPRVWRHRQTSRYALSLLAFERRVSRRKVAVELINKQLPTLRQRLAFFDQRTDHPALMAGMASLYQDTAGQLSGRLKILGQPEPLNQPATIDLIRACLFAGMRAAQVWHQLGGRRWMLWLHRRAMIADLRELAVRQYRGTRTRH